MNIDCLGAYTLHTLDTQIYFLMLKIFYVFCLLPIQGKYIEFPFYQVDLKSEQLFFVTQ